jgi:hypothetical protein
MVNISLDKILLIMVYLIIIILVILFLDYLFKVTVRKNRKNKIMAFARKKSTDTNKPIVVFNDKDNGVVIDTNGKKETFNGNINDIANEMADNSCVLVVSETLEYIDDSDQISLNNLIEQLKIISGGDLYCANFEKNSPRALWDYNIKNIMNESYYLPNDNISWTKPNNLQVNAQKFYAQIFKILPYNFFAKDSIVKV